MKFIKREKWTETDVDTLPIGELDNFDRKSGRLFDKTDDLLGALAKALSAFANDGGGHLVLGVDDTGIPDGVPQTVGRTSVREWLEQKIPHLVEYALSDFRVHIVERSVISRIPAGRVVLMIDVGDSAFAPHQCNFGGGESRKYVYYYHRRAGRSEPAPHFYLELLRQRLVNPVVEAKLVDLIPQRAGQTDDGIFLATLLRFSVENFGRVAAYKWQLQISAK
jgi:predicted HTH transcriptional regulator